MSGTSRAAVAAAAAAAALALAAGWCGGAVADLVLEDQVGATVRTSLFRYSPDFSPVTGVWLLFLHSDGCDASVYEVRRSEAVLRGRWNGTAIETVPLGASNHLLVAVSGYGCAMDEKARICGRFSWCRGVVSYTETSRTAGWEAMTNWKKKPSASNPVPVPVVEVSSIGGGFPDAFTEVVGTRERDAYPVRLTADNDVTAWNDTFESSNSDVALGFLIGLASLLALLVCSAPALGSCRTYRLASSDKDKDGGKAISVYAGNAIFGTMAFKGLFFKILTASAFIVSMTAYAGLFVFLILNYTIFEELGDGDQFPVDIRQQVYYDLPYLLLTYGAAGLYLQIIMRSVVPLTSFILGKSTRTSAAVFRWIAVVYHLVIVGLGLGLVWILTFFNVGELEGFQYFDVLSQASVLVHTVLLGVVTLWLFYNLRTSSRRTNASGRKSQLAAASRLFLLVSLVNLLRLLLIGVQIMLREIPMGPDYDERLRSPSRARDFSVAEQFLMLAFISADAVFYFIFMVFLQPVSAVASKNSNSHVVRSSGRRRNVPAPQEGDGDRDEGGDGDALVGDESYQSYEDVVTESRLLGPSARRRKRGGRRDATDNFNAVFMDFDD